MLEEVRDPIYVASGAVLMADVSSEPLADIAGVAPVLPSAANVALRGTARRPVLGILRRSEFLGSRGRRVEQQVPAEPGHDPIIHRAPIGKQG